MAIWFHSSLRRLRIRSRTFCRIAQAVLDQMDKSQGHLSISLVGSTKMRQLNRSFRQRDYPTDVLAFPMAHSPRPSPRLLGDVVICLPIAVTQAPTFGNTPDQEILRLLIHGTLHLLGYDHERNAKEAKRMQRKESQLFKRLSPVPKLLA